MTHIIHITSDINNSVFENFTVAIEENVKFYVAVHDCNHDKIKESYEIGFNNLIRDQKLRVKGSVQFIDLPNEKNRLDSLRFIINNLNYNMQDRFYFLEDGALLTIDAAEKLSYLEFEDADYYLIGETYIKFNDKFIVKSKVGKWKSKPKFWYTKNSPFSLSQVVFSAKFLTMFFFSNAAVNYPPIERLMRYATSTNALFEILDTKVILIKFDSLTIGQVSGMMELESSYVKSKLNLASKLYNNAVILRTVALAEDDWRIVGVIEKFIDIQMKKFKARFIKKSPLAIDLDRLYYQLSEAKKYPNLQEE